MIPDLFGAVRRHVAFRRVLRGVRRAFPRLLVRLEPVPDAPHTRTVSVFGARRKDVARIMAVIHALDWTHCRRCGCILAHVVDVYTTRRYYPELARRR
jgi:hypothetical protein